MGAAMRRRAVPNAPAAAQADPPPGVGDADANASRTSRSGLSANEATGRVGGLVGRAPRLDRLGRLVGVTRTMEQDALFRFALVLFADVVERVAQRLDGRFDRRLDVAAFQLHAVD